MPKFKPFGAKKPNKPKTYSDEEWKKLDTAQKEQAKKEQREFNRWMKDMDGRFSAVLTRLPAFADFVKGAKLLTMGQGKFAVASGLAHLSKGVLTGIFNDNTWYMYDGTYSIPGFNEVRPFDPESLAWLSENPTTVGTSHLSYINIAINPLINNDEFDLSTSDVYIKLREGLGTNIPYDEDTIKNYLTEVYHLAFIVKYYERIMGWRNVTSKIAPELHDGLMSYVATPLTSGVVQMKQNTMLTDSARFSAEADEMKLASAQLNGIKVPVKLMEFISHYIGGTFMDEKAANACLYQLQPNTFPMPVSRKTGTRQNVEITGWVYYSIEDINAELITKLAKHILKTYGFGIADTGKFIGYGDLTLLPADEYKPVVMCDPKFKASFKNAYTETIENMAAFADMDPEYVRVDMYDMNDVSMIAPIVMMGATLSTTDTPFNVVSQAAIISSENLRFIDGGSITLTHDTDTGRLKLYTDPIIGVQFSTLVSATDTFNVQKVGNTSTFVDIDAYSNTRILELADNAQNTINHRFTASIAGGTTDTPEYLVSSTTPLFYAVLSNPLGGYHRDNQIYKIYFAARVESSNSSAQYSPRVISIRDGVIAETGGFAIIPNTEIGNIDLKAYTTNFNPFEIIYRNDGNNRYFKVRYDSYELSDRNNTVFDVGAPNYGDTLPDARAAADIFAINSFSYKSPRYAIKQVYYEGTVTQAAIQFSKSANDELITWWSNNLDIHIPVFVKETVQINGFFNNEGTSNLYYPATLAKDVHTPVILSKDEIRTAQRWALLGLFDLEIERK